MALAHGRITRLLVNDMDLEVIKALANVPVELVLIYIIVQQQKQQTMLVEKICELRNRLETVLGNSNMRVGDLDDLLHGKGQN